MKDTLTIVAAKASDVQAIFNLIEQFSQQNVLLKRDKDEILANIRYFKLAKCLPANQASRLTPHKVIACASLYPYSPTLAEIRSLCVDPAYQGKGMAIKLLEAILTMATQEHFHQLITFTTQAGAIFEKLNFTPIPTHHVPAKVMKDCRFCPCYGNCPAKCYQRLL